VVPIHSIAPMDCQEIEIGLDLGGDLVAGVVADPARRQLDPQRQTREQLAQPRHRRQVGRDAAKVGHVPLRPLQEQLHPRVARRVARTGLWHWQPFQPHQLFTVHVELGARGREHT
jgi:hypothetical protein